MSPTDTNVEAASENADSGSGAARPIGRATKFIGVILFIIPFIGLLLIFLLWPGRFDGALVTYGQESKEVAKLEFELASAQTLKDQAEAKMKETGLALADMKTAEEDKKAAEVLISKKSAELEEAKKRVQEAAKQVVDSANSSDSNRLAWLSPEARLCLLVVLAGGLGSAVAAGRSFSGHIGRGTYKPSWEWWYFLRIPVGCSVAFIFYAVLRAGFVPWSFNEPGKALETVNPFGFVAVGALAGLYMNEAIQKMKDVMTAILTPDRSETAEEKKLEGPEVTKVDLVGSDRRTIKISGRNLKDAKVSVSGKDWTVISSSTTEIEAKGSEDFPKTETEVKVTSGGTKPLSKSIRVTIA